MDAGRPQRSGGGTAGEGGERKNHNQQERGEGGERPPPTLACRPPLQYDHTPNWSSALRDTSFFEKIAAKLALFNRHYAPEKVYLQFDRTFFEPGEAIWFNAWVRDANSLKTNTKSELLHVELLAPNGSVLKKITLLAKGGTAAGDFQLDPTATGGMYKIKAFTNWQRNTGDAFERDIQVQATVLPRLRMELDFLRKAYGPGDRVEAKLDLNTLANQPLANYDFIATVSLDGQRFTEVKGKTNGSGHARIQFDLPKNLSSNDGLLNVLIQYNGQTESISRSVPIVLNKIDLQFLPEGGDLVAGLPGTVAFKALNEFGKPADVEGEILNSKGLKISSFRSYHQGMGAFDLLPEPGETYHARLTKPEGISEKFGLPDAYPRGFTLRVTPSLIPHPSSLKNDSLQVEISSTENEPLNLALVSNGEIYFTQTLPAQAGTYRVKIPTATLPIGIAQLTLFDSREIPRAERLVFLNPDKKLNVSILTNKEKYLPREKVELTVKVTDERGLPMPGQFSLAVGDDNLLTFADDRQGNILAHLLLESELTGKVEEPNFYFDKKEKHLEKNQLLALDYLMMTQGWRRFGWDEILFQPVAALDYEAEEAGFDYSQNLDEIVVTGIGIIREKRSVAYSTTAVTADEVKKEKRRTKNKATAPPQQPKPTQRIAQVELPQATDQAKEVTLTSDQIKNLPPRDVNTLASMSAGVASDDDARVLNIRGSRSDATNYYIDGVRVQGQPGGVPAQFGNQKEMAAVEEKVVFKDQSIQEESRVAVPAAKTGALPPPPPPPAENDAEVFKVVEEMPIFMASGCENLATKEERQRCSQSKMLEFIYQNASYPAIAKENCVEGTVVVNFTVEKDGRIAGAKVVRDVGGGLGQEALRIVGMMDGQWQPGKQRGRPVKVQYTLPIKFRLDGSMNIGEAQVSNSQNIYHHRQFYAPKYDAPSEIPNPKSESPRTDFRKTVFWQPNLIVGRSGMATVEFYNTDAISTFRATVEGLGVDGSIGRGEQRFFTQMPFGMDVKIPTNLLTGDRLVLPLTLANNTDKAINGQLSLSAPAGFSLVKQLPETLTLKAGETMTIYPEYEVGFDAKTGALQVAFQAAGFSDDFAERVDVQPRGFPVAQVFGGSALEQTFNFDINDPIEGSLQAALTVHPSVLSDLTSGLERMLRQPGGCFEQTSSSNYPNVLVLNYLKTTGNAAREIQTQAEGFLDSGYKRLLTFEVPGGGFDWYGKPPAHEALTAYGLMEFVDMQQVYPVEQDLIDRTAKWLLSRRDGQGGWSNGRPGLHSWKQQSAISDAYITWAVTEAGFGKQISKEIEKPVRDAKETQDPYIMALAANILLKTGDKRAGEMLTQLAALQYPDGSWAGKTNSMTHSTGQNLNVETTGLATLAFVERMSTSAQAKSDYTRLAENAVKYLASAKSPYGFGSTQATILALKALVKHAELYRQSMNGGAVAVLVNGKQVASRSLQDEKEPIVFNSLVQHFKQGKNSVKIRFTGTDTPLPYDLAVAYNTRQPQSSPDCLLHLETTLSSSSNPTEIQNPKIQNPKSKMGETVRLTTTLANRSEAPVANPIAIVGIPAGLSVQPWQVKEMQEKNLFDFYEIKDGYVIFYFREMAGSEVKNIHLDLKADVPGSYEAPASSAYLYYSNDAVVWSKPERVVVEVGH